MDVVDKDKEFEIFLDLYNKKKMLVNWRKNSLSVAIQDITCDKIVYGDEFREFTSDILQLVKCKILGDDYNDDEDNEKYADKFIGNDKELKDDIITRCKSRLNICNNMEYEILTKRNKELKPMCHSVLINMNFDKPSVLDELFEQISFELSIKDLKQMQEILTKSLEEVNELNKCTGCYD